MFVLYILFSEKLDRYYVGYTNDIDRRIAEHNRIKGKWLAQQVEHSALPKGPGLACSGTNRFALCLYVIILSFVPSLFHRKMTIFNKHEMKHTT
jgi:hypothetical protein